MQVVLRQGLVRGLGEKAAVPADGAMDKEDSTGRILQTAQTWAGTGVGSDLVEQQQHRNVEVLDYHLARLAGSCRLGQGHCLKILFPHWSDWWIWPQSL